MGGAASSDRQLWREGRDRLGWPGGGGAMRGNGDADADDDDGGNGAHGGVKIPSQLEEEKEDNAEKEKEKDNAPDCVPELRASSSGSSGGRRRQTTTKPKRQSTNERLGELARGAAVFHPVDTELDENSRKYVTVLPKGGHWLKLGGVTMQFGCPPETIKDSMTLGLEVPRYYVVLGDLFSRTKGVNYAELEFPCYFNFFIRKQRTVVLTTKAIEQRIRALFRETLLGPQEEDFNVALDYPEGCSKDHFPDFIKEGEWLDSARKTLSVDSLLEFKIFEPAEWDSTGYAHVYQVELPEDIFVRYYRDQRAYHVVSKTHLPIEIEDLVIHVEDIIRRIEEESASSELQANLIESQSSLTELPAFGVTMLGTSHGFDPKGQTTGFVLWANRRGTMVDPPPTALDCLEALGISSRTIDSIVLTHCHSDHDAGAFRRLLFDQHITIYTTRTIFESFVRKYSNVSGFSNEFLQQLLLVKFVIIGEETFIHGASWKFFYTLHTIPCIGFEVTLNGKSIAYSGDTNQSPELFKRMYDEGIIGEGRYKSLTNFPWDADMILHEAGVPPIHTPMSELLKLSDEIKKKLYVVHVAKKDVPPDAGFHTISQGETRLVDIPRNELDTAIEILDVLSTVELLRDACKYFRDALHCMYMIQNDVFQPGELIVKAGDPGDRFFIITKGTAVVSWENNGIKGSKLFHVGDYFGEASLVTGEPRNADVVAQDHVRVATLSRQHFEHLISGTSIKEKLIALAKIREKNTWQLISQNSVTRLLTSTAKTQLEIAMIEKEYNKGDILWEVGDPAEMLLFIQSGSFHIKADPQMLRERKLNLSITVEKEAGSALFGGSATKRSTTVTSTSSTRKKSVLLTRSDSRKSLNSDAEIELAETRILEGIVKSGAFIGDFDAVFADEAVASTVVCLESGTGLIIPRPLWKQFCAKFPGGLLFFMNKHIAL